MADDVLKQLNNMTSGLNDLRDSIKEIDKAIPDFTNGMLTAMQK